MALVNYKPKDWLVTRQDSNTIVIRDKHDTICTIVHPHGDDKAEINSKHIAKVPEMLEALKEAKRMYEKVQPAGGWQGVYEQICYALKP